MDAPSVGAGAPPSSPCSVCHALMDDEPRGWTVGGKVDMAFEHMSGLRDDQALIIKAVEVLYQDLVIALGSAPPSADRAASLRALRQSYLWFVEAVRTDGAF